MNRTREAYHMGEDEQVAVNNMVVETPFRMVQQCNVMGLADTRNQTCIIVQCTLLELVQHFNIELKKLLKEESCVFEGATTCLTDKRGL